MKNFQIRNLDSIGKLFVGLFTTLMLCVLLWVAFIYYVTEGMIPEGGKPLYLQNESYQKDYKDENVESTDSLEFEEFKEKLEHNVGMAHTHINGQTLLFFALGLTFLFTSTPNKMKKIAYLVFSVSIVVHAIGLSGKGFYWMYADVLTLSGLSLVVCMLYMAFRIYIDLGKAPEKESA